VFPRWEGVLIMNRTHLKVLRQGVNAWNDWRFQEHSTRPDQDPFTRPDLSGADLSGAQLQGANFAKVDLSGATLNGTNLRHAHLREANLHGAELRNVLLNYADLFRANLKEADLSRLDLSGATLMEADLSGADLRWANFSKTSLMGANLKGADLSEAILLLVNFHSASLRSATLKRALLNGSNLTEADLSEADLKGANLQYVNLVDADLRGADLTGCRIYGISAWGVKLDEHTKQQDLVITKDGELEVSADNIEVAQFVYLLLHNEKIREAIDTIGKKGVLLLGRFTDGRLALLERLRQELRVRGFVPMVFNFDKPETKDFTETVRLLAGLSHFVIVDITNPRSAPLELQATVPECMVPFVPILEKGEEPFAMLRDLWVKHREWVFEPIRYPSVDRLIEVLDAEVIRPAQARFAQLLARKAQTFQVRDI
jgi:uncharacterized protein YjbI with pentapeptide repeats